MYTDEQLKESKSKGLMFATRKQQTMEEWKPGDELVAEQKDWANGPVVVLTNKNGYGASSLAVELFHSLVGKQMTKDPKTGVWEVPAGMAIVVAANRKISIEKIAA